MLVNGQEYIWLRNARFPQAANIFCARRRSKVLEYFGNHKYDISLKTCFLVGGTDGLGRRIMNMFGKLFKSLENFEKVQQSTFIER